MEIINNSVFLTKDDLHPSQSHKHEDDVFLCDFKVNHQLLNKSTDVVFVKQHGDTRYFKIKRFRNFINQSLLSNRTK